MLAAVGIIDWESVWRKRVRRLRSLDRLAVAEFWLADFSLRVHFFLDWGASEKHPPLNLCGTENKGVTKMGACNRMKTKGRKCSRFALGESERTEGSERGTGRRRQTGS